MTTPDGSPDPRLVQLRLVGTLERITEVLWEGAPSVRPAQNIATFVSRLRRVLGADVIRGGRPGYSLGLPPAVQVDLDGAGRWAEEAEIASPADYLPVPADGAARAAALIADLL